jgi:Methylenetetrahydrofolate reductase
MSDYLVEPRPTLKRWLAGERIGPLPMRGADQDPPELSFEFFPPRTEALEQQLWTCIRRLAPLSPRFVSVTYGAGGTTHARTHATVSRLVQETDLTPAAHLTCVGASRAEVDTVARGYWEAGIRHIVALRGDPPPGTEYTPHSGGYHYASDLVAGRPLAPHPPGRAAAARGRASRNAGQTDAAADAVPATTASRSRLAARAPLPAACAAGHPVRQAMPRGRSAHLNDDRRRRVAANDSRVITQ